MKETKCGICDEEFNFGDMFYDDLCDICAEGEGRSFEKEEAGESDKQTE